jgi:hypothetical protein
MIGFLEDIKMLQMKHTKTILFIVKIKNNYIS